MDACNRPECLGGTRSDAAVVGGGLGQSPFREHTVLHQLRWLGSFVFFDRDVVARSDQAAFVRTVYQLSTFHPRVGIQNCSHH